jgi:hypothetical protein
VYPNRVRTGDNDSGHTAALPLNDGPQLHGEPEHDHTTACDANPTTGGTVVDVVDVVAGTVDVVDVVAGTVVVVVDVVVGG